MADVELKKVETAAEPPTGDAPAPGWIVGLLWTTVLWAVYYYVIAG